MNNQKLIEKIWFADEISRFTQADDYATAARLLLERQKQDWRRLYQGYKSLDSVQTKSFDFEGFSIKAQYNPMRILSTSAKVDETSVKQRECFLCTGNLPAGQKGILYGDEYLILGNPYPIFPGHFTIININHFPQRIKEVFYLMLSLSRSMHRYYTVFYNGPRCGASVPNHLHFQAGSKLVMSVENEFDSLKKNYGEQLYKDFDFSIHAIDDGMRRIISFEGNDEDILIHSFHSFYEILTTLDNTAPGLVNIKNGDEPMMNILSSYEPGKGWRIIIFLRGSHRPSRYFAQDESQMLISPAAVDLGGVCILPVEKDFERITKGDLVEVFREVSIGKRIF